jgi:hypothetical protein
MNDDSNYRKQAISRFDRWSLSESVMKGKFAIVSVIIAFAISSFAAPAPSGVFVIAAQ